MKISLVTPNYNYAAFVRQAIQSVVGQNWPSLEHIVVDDGSTDGSAEAVEAMVPTLPPGRLRLIRTENRGQTPAINTALSHATGSILGWLNSDDTLVDGVLPSIASYFLRHPETDIVYGDANVMDLDGCFIYRIRHLKYSYRTGAYSGFGNILTSNAVFWRRSVMERSGVLREDLRCNMDGEFFARLFHGSSFDYLPIPLSNFRQQPFTLASKNDERWRETVQREVLLERRLSYGFLPESRFLPLRFSLPLRAFFRMNRVVRRAMHLHYLKKKFEINRYLAAVGRSGKA